MDKLVIIRGGGDLATGVAQKFYRSGFPLLILEQDSPTAIRRTVAMSECVYEGEYEVEGMRARHIRELSELDSCRADCVIPLMTDPCASVVDYLRPAVLIDAIIAKRNLGTHMGMADITIALGPGFCAGTDVNAVIETNRGHDLARLILKGYAQPDTGTPGIIAGKGSERVIRAAGEGEFIPLKGIGDIADEGEALFKAGQSISYAPFRGLIRGMLREGAIVKPGMKSADIDPRTDIDVNSVSDKARAIGGAALEAALYFMARGGKNDV